MRFEEYEEEEQEGSKEGDGEKRQRKEKRRETRFHFPTVGAFYIHDDWFGPIVGVLVLRAGKQES